MMLQVAWECVPMVLVSAVHIALGWAWHIGYRAKHHWSLKREGALAAAALVAILGAIDLSRGHHGAPPESPVAAKSDRYAVTTTPAATAVATPVVTEATRPIQIMPSLAEAAPAEIDTVPASPSPELAQSSDPIGDKILERLGDEPATASVTPKPK